MQNDVSANGNTESSIFLTDPERDRIQNAANRIKTPIFVVRRATEPYDEWVYFIDARARTRSRISKSLPSAGDFKEGLRSSLYIFKGQVAPDVPHERFAPPLSDKKGSS